MVNLVFKYFIFMVNGEYFFVFREEGKEGKGESGSFIVFYLFVK